MGKKAKRTKLTDKIALKIENLMCLLKVIIYSSEDKLEKDTLAWIAYDEAKRIEKLNQKIHKYL